MRKVKMGNLEISRMVMGGNPFSGFSHQGPERDAEMMRFYTVDRIKETLQKAEAAGVNTFFGRTDRHVRRLLREYWDEGGTIQWFGQTATELGDQAKAARDAVSDGAKGAYIHGGQVDYLYAQKRYEELGDLLKAIKDCGVPAGFAGHSVDAHKWVSENLDPDFQMCSYYDPSPRADNPHHVSTHDEKWDDGHRDEMVALIQTIEHPVVHYKVFAGGNRPVDAGFRFLAGSMRENDLVCIGHYVGDNPNMIEENVNTFDTMVEKRK